MQLLEAQHRSDAIDVLPYASSESPGAAQSLQHRRVGFLAMAVGISATIIVMAAALTTRTCGCTYTQVAVARSHVSRGGALACAIKLYGMNAGHYPESLDVLTRVPGDPLARARHGDSPYLESAALLDPWGNPYQYRMPGNGGGDGWDLWSLGEDGLDGTEDDIGNWQSERR